MANVDAQMIVLAQGLADWRAVFSPWVSTFLATLLLIGGTLTTLCMLGGSAYAASRVLRKSATDADNMKIMVWMSRPSNVAHPACLMALLFVLPYLAVVTLDGLLSLWSLLQIWSYRFFGNRSLTSPMLGIPFIGILMAALYTMWRLLRPGMSPEPRNVKRIPDNHGLCLAYLFAAIFLSPTVTYMAAVLCDRLLDFNDPSGGSRAHHDGLWLITALLLTFMFFVQCTVGGLSGRIRTGSLPSSLPKPEPQRMVFITSNIEPTRFLAALLLLQFTVFLTIIALDGFMDTYLFSDTGSPLLGLSLLVLLWTAFSILSSIWPDTPRLVGQERATNCRIHVRIFLFAGLMLAAECVATRALVLTDTFGQADGAFVYPALSLVALSIVATTGAAVALSARVLSLIGETRDG